MIRGNANAEARRASRSSRARPVLAGIALIGATTSCSTVDRTPRADDSCRAESSTPERASTPAPVRKPAPPSEPPAASLGAREVFPFVRVDTEAGYVEFDSMVCIDAHNPNTPRVYLEVLACTPDTREHESLVMTRARPSHVHAALLLLGLTPGKPGEWNWEGERIRAIPPEGPRLRVMALVAGREPEALESWVINARDGRGLPEIHPGARFVFAGSQMIPRAEPAYRADGEGCLVGLATFGGETVAWSAMIHHDSQIEEPQWIADAAKVPAFGTPVVVRIVLDP